MILLACSLCRLQNLGRVGEKCCHLDWQFFTLTLYRCKWLQGVGWWRSKNIQFRNIQEFVYKSVKPPCSPAAPKMNWVRVTVAPSPSRCSGKEVGEESGTNTEFSYFSVAHLATNFDVRVTGIAAMKVRKAYFWALRGLTTPERKLVGSPKTFA